MAWDPKYKWLDTKGIFRKSKCFLSSSPLHRLHFFCVSFSPCLSTLAPFLAALSVLAISGGCYRHFWSCLHLLLRCPLGHHWFVCAHILGTHWRVAALHTGLQAATLFSCAHKHAGCHVWQGSLQHSNKCLRRRRSCFQSWCLNIFFIAVQTQGLQFGVLFIHSSRDAIESLI